MDEWADTADHDPIEDEEWGGYDSRPNPEVLLSRKCSTCIYWEDGARMSLRPGRVMEMTAQSRATDSNVTCHKSKSMAGEFDFDAWCRGNVDEVGWGQMMRIQERFGGLPERDPQRGKDDE